MNDETTPPPPPDGSGEKSQETKRPSVVVTEEQKKVVVTEGQLKWAQFHSKRRAQSVRNKVEEMWHTPASSADVEGAQSDDGNTTEESFSIEDEDEASRKLLRKKLEEARRKKPSVSRGRRALLRVSKRAYAKRQEDIVKFGFRCSDGDMEDDDNHDDALAAKFADETAWKKARRNRRRRKAKSTQERLRRFENAFRAMMMSIAAASQPQNPEIAVPTKVWSRPEDAKRFVSVDGRQYRDLKWGETGSGSRERVAQMLTTTDFASMPIDPRASWLVHIPSKQQDRTMVGPYSFPTNADGDLLIPENINGGGDKMVPVPLGSEKFNEIVGTLQSQAQLSQQQKDQLEVMMKSRSHDFKWQVANRSQAALNQGYEDEDEYEDDLEDADDEEDALNPEHLKTIAAEYLTEFVANTDEKEVIAALGEQYRDEVGSLVEAASDHGQPTCTSTSSKDIVRRYLQGMNSATDASASEKPQASEEFETQDHQSQMASFAGIAAMYLAELSRPRKINKTLISCRQEQGLLVKELKSILGELYASGSFSGADEDVQNAGSLYESNKHDIESIIAKFTLAKLPPDGYTESDVVSELRQRDGREFLKLLVQYLEKVKQVAKKQETVRNEKKSSRRGSVASRYMETLGKLPMAGSESNQDDPTECVDEDQALVEQIALEFLSGALCDEQDVISVIRKEKQSTVPMVVMKYLQALSDSVAIGKETRIQHDNIQSTTSVDHFDCSRSIFAELGDPTLDQRANQRTFEAITSRYLSNITHLSEDSIFMELGREERQGFSRIITTHLDEIIVLQQQWKPTRKMGTPATSYLQSLDFDPSLAEDSMYGLNHQDVEGIVAQYIDQISGSSHKISFSAPSKQQEGTKFSWLVASYLGSLCDHLHQDGDGKGTIQQTGAVSKYFESVGASMLNSTSDLEDDSESGNYFQGDSGPSTTSSNGPTMESTETSRQASGGIAAGLSTKFSNGSAVKRTEGTRSSITPPPPVGTRRTPQASGGIAAKYLTAVIDAEEDDDIFAELRKQDSPKFAENTLQAVSFPVQRHHESQDMHPAQHQGGFGEVHVQSAPNVLSPLSQATGLPQVLQTEIVLDRKTAASYLSRLRPECNEHDIQVAIGSIGNSDQARAQFARGVTELLMGVRENLNPKRSRAAASRYLAAMRGLQVDPEPEAQDNFESVPIQDACEMLAECSCKGDPPQLSQALKKLGKEDGEFFAEFIAGYLDGSVLPAGTCEETSFNELPGGVPLNGKLSQESPGANSQTESDFFAGMRQKTVDVNLPTLDQRAEAKRLSYLYGSRRTTPKNTNFSDEHKGDNVPLPSTTKANGDVLKNSTFNSMENRRASFRNDVEEEKKTSGPGSPTFDSAELAFAQGDAENIPFDPQDPPSTETYSGIAQPVVSPSCSHGSNSEFTPERLRDFHQSVMDKSALIGEVNAEQTIIDTDGTTSDASDTEMSPRRLASLMLSPTILTKRHKQAVQAIENKKWDQVSYLLNANPWLAEMPEIRTSQYLLHKVAFYGATAPSELCTEVVKMYPAAEKFDKRGMLPLHSASEAGNVRMINLLGDRFPSGASVRDEEGRLPIHLAIASHGTRGGTQASLLEVVKSVLTFFPGALAVADNLGNLPLHVAAECLGGDNGIDVINFLLDEAQKQLKRDDGVRFRNKPRVEDSESATGTSATEATTEMNRDDDYDDQLPPSMVENNMGNIPLWLALAKSAPSEIIESLAIGPGGRQSALKQDTNGNTALHRLLLQDCLQMTALKSLLKVAPESASVANVERMLPIEMACLKGVAPEVVLEILLVDLPIALSDGIKPLGEGASLWFLACECHDRYLGVLEKLISMCSYQQVHELAFASRDGSHSTLISSASPECGEFLTVSLLFVGRFEFLQYDPKSISGEVKVFDALDYGTADAPYEEGRRVSLKCFTSEQQYEEEISSLRSMELDFDYVAQVSCFVVGERDSYQSGGRQQFCVSIEQASLTLDRVVAGMLKNDACRENTGLRRKYVNKILSVLRIVAKALHRLHSFGVIHGNLVPEACGKCDGATWKLLGTLDFQSMGAKFDANLFGAAAPPESLEPHNSAVAVDRQAAFRTNLAVDPSIDAWGFGKLSYEVLIGESLVEFDTSREVHHDHRSLLKLLHWSTIDLVDVRRRLRQAGVPDSAVHVITKCLSPDPSSRPSMSEVLRRGPWEDGQQRPPQQLSQAPPELHEC